jgi:hypothetical protein
VEALIAYRQAAELWSSIGLSDLVEQILAPRMAETEKRVTV